MILFLCYMHTNNTLRQKRHKESKLQRYEKNLNFAQKSFKRLTRIRCKSTHFLSDLNVNLPQLVPKYKERMPANRASIQLSILNSQFSTFNFQLSTFNFQQPPGGRLCLGERRGWPRTPRRADWRAWRSGVPSLPCAAPRARRRHAG